MKLEDHPDWISQDRGGHWFAYQGTIHRIPALAKLAGCARDTFAARLKKGLLVADSIAYIKPVWQRRSKPTHHTQTMPQSRIDAIRAKYHMFQRPNGQWSMPFDERVIQRLTEKICTAGMSTKATAGDVGRCPKLELDGLYAYCEHPTAGVTAKPFDEDYN